MRISDWSSDVCSSDLTENYQLLFGGSGAEDASLAKIVGPGFDEDGIFDAVEKATDVYKSLRPEGERYLDTYRRAGMQPSTEADRKSVVWGKRVSVRLDLVGRRNIQKTHKRGKLKL